jgi:nitronate monooxygenase
MRNNKGKHWMRLFYTLCSALQLRNTMQDQKKVKDFWQAGKSVAGITQIETAVKIVNDFENAIIGRRCTRL